MLKSGVKTLSIIDTISELATDKTEASRLTLPSPISIRSPPQHITPPSGFHQGARPGSGSKKVIPPPRNPKVSVPLSTPPHQLKFFDGGAKPRNNGISNGGFFASSPIKKTSLPPGAKLNFSASPQQHATNAGAVTTAVHGIISPRAKNGQNDASFHQRSFDRHHPHNSFEHASHQQQQRANNQTPDWIRDIFQFAKTGHHEKLVSLRHEIGGKSNTCVNLSVDDWHRKSLCIQYTYTVLEFGT